MPITVRNAKITSLSISGDKVTGTYELMSEKGKVIAKQTFNDYNGMNVELSRDSKECIEDLLTSLTFDIEMTAGINEAVKELK